MIVVDDQVRGQLDDLREILARVCPGRNPTALLSQEVGEELQDLRGFIESQNVFGG